MFNSLFNKKSTAVILKIEGMHCEGCSNTLKGVLKTIKGIRKNEVTLAENQAKIDFDESKISIEEIINQIQLKTPYKVTDKTIS